MRNTKTLGTVSFVMAALCVTALAPQLSYAKGAKTAKVAKLAIGTKGDNLAFNKATMTVKAGENVQLTFKNNASPKSGLQHNWVLVNPGTIDTVGQAAMAASPDQGYVPASADVLAHTGLVNAGKSETIKFTAPAKPGDYPYICSFPGHYMTMKGTLKVKK